MSEQTPRTHPDLWLDPADDPRTATGPARGEKEVVLGYLDHYRTTLELKCQGLDAEQLARRAVPPSTLSLLGLVRHLAAVESSWSRRVLLGQTDVPRLFRTPENRDADFDGAVADDAVVAEAWEHWHREVTSARGVEATIDLGATVAHDGEQIEVRDVLVHLVEEYARHLGHADLLREVVDGRTGQ